MGYHSSQMHQYVQDSEAKEILAAVLEGEISVTTAKTWLKLSGADYVDLPEFLALEE